MKKFNKFLLLSALFPSIAFAQANQPSGVTPLVQTLTFGGTVISNQWTPNSQILANIQITGTFVGSCQLEEQLDGINWTEFYIAAGGSVVQDKIYSVPVVDNFITPKYQTPVRVNCSNLTSGSANVVLNQ